jgi:hypothetical protein
MHCQVSLKMEMFVSRPHKELPIVSNLVERGSSRCQESYMAGQESIKNRFLNLRITRTRSVGQLHSSV